MMRFMRLSSCPVVRVPANGFCWKRSEVMRPLWALTKVPPMRTPSLTVTSVRPPIRLVKLLTKEGVATCPAPITGVLIRDMSTVAETRSEE